MTRNLRPEEPREPQAAFLSFLRSLPVHSPRELDQLLTDSGYRGQLQARRALCLLAYRHLRRVRRIHLEGFSPDRLPPKTNVLMVGPTGCGKTFLVELLFGKLLGLPTVVADMSNLTETGYIGDDAITLLTRLLRQTNNDPYRASVGIVCLDEFDKLATSGNTARFDGQGTTKDVSGMGVQKELLKMLEASDLDVPLDQNNSLYSHRVRFPTGDLSFVACGAFSGFKLAARLSEKDGPRLGFSAEPEGRPTESIAAHFRQAELDSVENFRVYGFLPELIGRFGRLVPFLPLDQDTLFQILRDNVLNQYRREFAEEGLDLCVGDGVLLAVAKMAEKRKTGARGLSAALVHVLEDVAYEGFAGHRTGRVRLFLEGDQVRSRLEC